MKNSDIDLSVYQKENSIIEGNVNSVNLESVFRNNIGGYFLNEQTLFLARFNTIANLIPEPEINCHKAQLWLIENYGNEIKDNHYCKRYYGNKGIAELDDVFYFLFEDLLIYFDCHQSYVKFLFRRTEISKVNKMIESIKKFKKRKSKAIPMMSLLVNTTNGIDTKSLNIKKPKLNIIDNYNDDFLPLHQSIIKRLSQKDDKGLVLLHGKPGTGKTSYIRYLISILKKEVIFLPPNMASAITNPELISILIDNPNSVFVIEDAENIIMDREKEGNSPVSALLNISDGLLADCLNIQVICSFNTDISKIDSALMRKGRLIAKYEFKELEVEKARQLSKKLGFETQIDDPMTLAAIYNQTDQEFQNKAVRPAIGFKISA
ncbi:MAG: AAA family ATPase [Arcicella sp.]|nr:AAA family ATPase [Arcicella sp.]